MRILPKDGLPYITVRIYSDKDRTNRQDDASVRRSLVRAIVCAHVPYNGVLFYTLVYSSGPPWLADVFEGQACPECGKILRERRIQAAPSFGVTQAAAFLRELKK